ncbi:MAG: DNA replication/repair protein RecF [Acidobacteria bacterium]|nr:DNA replication/repair protein RecF [Acidobacteriota bacterium]
MHITHLSLQDFRSYKVLELPLKTKQSIFIGDNGEGKTNIIEAIMYLSLLSSHRVSQDTPLIKLGAERAYIRAKVLQDNRSQLIELEINSNKANRAKVNQNPVRSQKEILGITQAIAFSPEDLDLVRGDPNERRAFIDQLLIQRNPRMSGVITDYERALKQRNALLKSRAPIQSLEPWDEHLTKFGAELIASRIELIETLQPHFIAAYKNLAEKKLAGIAYKSNINQLSNDRDSNQNLLISKILEVRDQERERGITLVGPHRDDVLLSLGEHQVKGYASHGESWSIALALRLASFQLLKEEGNQPILILDDVFSELDEARREKLVQLAEEAEQTFITVAVESDLPKNLNGARYLVKSGMVKEL